MSTVTDWGNMIMNIVNIGFSVNTGQIERGYQRLNNMGDAAENTEAKIRKMAAAVTALIVTGKQYTADE